MIHSEKTIHQLYTSLATGNISNIEACYASKVKFHDPIFGTLLDYEVPKMWKMLTKKSKGNLEIEYSILKCNDFKASVKWTAKYTFGKKNRKVINNIKSEFHFKDGLIIKQDDDFDIWAWSKQALGLSGILLGWTGYLQRKIQLQAINSLKNYKENTFTN
ncbi:MAG TPA: nuclear transport factor 2 family protein [Flavobacterium sp.]|nr:nuclear transport factor 2 family protein [Flavobacterium sp.]